MSKKKKEEDNSEEALNQIKKALGISKSQDISGMFADQYVAIKDVIPTGIADLDRILTPRHHQETGAGGIPRGFAYEFYGPYAGGKSSLCHMLMASVTKAGGFGFWADAESSYVGEWAQKYGVVTNRVLLWNGDRLNEGEQAHGEWFLDKLEKVAASGAIQLAVVDSMTALQPREIHEQALDQNARVGAGARMMSRFMPRITTAARKGNCAVIFINQIRQKVGIVYGNPETTPYGEAPKFYSSLRLRISRMPKSETGIMKDGVQIGLRSNVLVEKSRFGPPGEETVMPIYYSADVKPHPLDVIIDAALSSRVIKSQTRDGVQNFRFGEIKCHGIDHLKTELIDNPDQTIAVVRQITDQKYEFDTDVKEYIAEIEKGLPPAAKSPEEPKAEKTLPKHKTIINEGDPGA